MLLKFHIINLIMLPQVPKQAKSRFALVVNHHYQSSCWFWYHSFLISFFGSTPNLDENMM